MSPTAEPDRTPPSIAGSPRPPGAPRTTCSTRTPGTSGARTSPSGPGAPSARTTATTATRGTPSRTITRGPARTGGTRTAWPGSRTSATSCAWRWRCGTAPTRSSRSGCSASPARRATTARTSRSTGGTSTGCPATRWLRWRYHYPQARVPVPATSSTRTAAAGLDDPEFELLDTGVFDDGRYWIVDVAYAKASPPRSSCRITIENHGPDEATLHVLPTLWFRNTWRWVGLRRRSPRCAWTATRSTVEHPRLAGYRLEAAPGPTAAARRRCSATTRPTRPACSVAAPITPYPKDGINDHVVAGAATVNPRATGHEGRLVVPAAPSRAAAARELRLRLRRPASRGRRSRRAARRSAWARRVRRRRRRAREREADEFYAALAPDDIDAERMRVLRQACAGLVWSKQMYPYRVGRVARRRPGASRPRRPDTRRAATPAGATSTPSTCWPCPIRGSTRGSRPGTSPSTPSPGRTSIRRSPSTSCIVLLREWFLHPNGALPAYEWSFDDVNPPVHALAALRVFVIDGGTDLDFLERVFQKLLLNFTWWLNRAGPRRQQPLRRRLPRARQHQPDRPVAPAAGRAARPGRRHRVDGLLLARRCSASPRRLAETNRVYDDMVVKFLEQFVMIVEALERLRPLRPRATASSTTGSSAGRARHADQGRRPSVGVIPAAAGRDPARSQHRTTRPAARQALRPPDRHETGTRAERRSPARSATTAGDADRVLVSRRRPRPAERTLATLFDEAAFLSPHGLRSLSKRHDGARTRSPAMPRCDDRLRAGRVAHRHVRRQLQLARPGLVPAQLPGHPGPRAVRPLLRRRLHASSTRPGRASSGPSREIADDLADRLIVIWLPGPDGRRPVYGGIELAADRPGLEGQPAVLRVLPRRQRRRPRRHAPDRAGRRSSPTCILDPPSAASR